MARRTLLLQDLESRSVPASLPRTSTEIFALKRKRAGHQLRSHGDAKGGMIDEGNLSSGSILNHVKLLKALFTYAFENEHITSNPIARIKYSAGDRKER